MRIDSSFTVNAPPDQVFAYLLDVNQVVACVPGAELLEVVDMQTFTGKIKIKLGAIQVAYKGTAHIVETEESDDGVTVTIQAEGREIGGQGTARANLELTVAGADGGARVDIATDLTVTGKVAQFGRGVMEDVSRRLVEQMGQCISAQIQSAPTS